MNGVKESIITNSAGKKLLLWSAVLSDGILYDAADYIPDNADEKQMAEIRLSCKKAMERRQQFIDGTLNKDHVAWQHER